MSNKKIIAISIGIMCFLLTIAICVQLKTVEKNSIKISGSITENSLRDEVLRWKELYERRYAQTQDKQTELDNESRRILRNDERAKTLQEQLEDLQRMIGYTDLNGPRSYCYFR